MKYMSTQGLEKDLTFQDVLFAGYARDKGLYMPDQVPRITTEEFHSWAKLTYEDLMVEILRKYIDDCEIPCADLKNVVSSALKNFNIPEIIRVERLDGGLNIVELFHGTTMAFKDLALSVVGTLIQYFMRKTNENIIILVGTSGDTGSAAINSVRSRDHIDIIVLLPNGRCSQIQELQMTTVLDDNVHLYGVDGTSDDLDIPIKQCFEDAEFVKLHNLVSINSINWGRILAQITHYFYAYYQLCGQIGNPIQFVVPTGAAGNITSGSLAQMMGIPITLVAAVNQNDIVARTLTNGDFSMKGKAIPSFSSAMDIQMPYNIERLLFLYSGKNTKLISQLMTEREENGKIQISDELVDAMKKVITDCIVVSDEEVTSVMSRVHKDHNYLLCPHTAVAVKYHYSSRPMNCQRGYIATASPAKFPEAVVKAGCKPITEGVDHLDALPTKCTRLQKSENWYDILVKKIEMITSLKKC